MTFTVADFTATTACGSLTYSNTKPAAATFVNDSSGAGKTFVWYSTDASLAGTYILKVTATYTGGTKDVTFNLVVTA